MSVKDYNKVINVYDVLTNDIIFTMDYDDFHDLKNGNKFLSEKICQFLDSSKELSIKFGYKS